MGTSSTTTKEKTRTYQLKHSHFSTLFKREENKFKLEKKQFDDIHQQLEDYNFTETWEVFFEVLSKEKKLTWLDLDGNEIGDLYSVEKVKIKRLSEFISPSISLSWLDLSNNNIEDNGVKLLSQSLVVNNSIKVILLNKNRITSMGMYYLTESLKFNSSITKIHISYNNICDEGLSYLQSMLQVNSTITHISIKSNIFTIVGIEKITEILPFSSIIWMDISENKLGLSELALFGEASHSSKLNVKINLKTIKVEKDELFDYFDQTQFLNVYYFNSHGCEIGFKKRFTTASVFNRKIDKEFIL